MNKDTFLLTVCVAFVAGSSLGQGNNRTPEAVLYEFDLVVLSNTVRSNGIGGQLADLTNGTTGRISFLVDTDPNRYPDDPLPSFRSYAINELMFEAGAISTGGSPGFYPSPTFIHAFNIQDDGLASNDRVLDAITSVVALDDPEFGISVFQLSQYAPLGDSATLIDGIDLPLSIDVSLSESLDFHISSNIDGISRVNFDVTGVTITPIPSAPAGALFALSGVLAMRRRR